MNTVRTVSDTKRAFYGAHTHPINSIYRRVVDELMVEMHLLTVNQHFVYSPIYALGVVTTFDRFMQGYRPESDVSSIFNALCAAVGGDSGKYRQDAEQLKSSLNGVAWEQLVKTDASGPAGDALKALVNAPHFKYTRLFAIGLYTMLEQIDAPASQDDAQRQTLLGELATTLSLSNERIEKDLELYRGNLDKMAQAQQAIADTIAAERKRRDQREQEKAAAAATADATSDDESAADADGTATDDDSQTAS
ncbi:photosystem II biogenesis protein Psp29 [filamentous cyanobacterium LEGE 11480]|uniref:Protein Thf1 n=1 Tax=Romeriopsis navalis LEGE 11480 TaxID=2777977 RepID=A0A928VI98_9CYAN|nr:photosystem II biogenesis protein Psp29 [Romeriopsis navalis]MBE9028268.1 photosystem II biogenesis protein Psp29 [Romeriopsis navalis LEGE 11480]